MNLSPEFKKIVRALKTPALIQDYLNSIGMRNPDGDILVRSPLSVARERSASCMEGALFAVAVCELHGQNAWLVDLKVSPKNTKDVDHVVAVFKQHGHYGAISKTNHGVLRYREPIYKTIRELVLSYFHEYFLDDGTKTLRSYSRLFPVIKKYGYGWIESKEDLFEIACDLDAFPHLPILPAQAIRTLRKADAIEISVGRLTEQ